MRVALTGDGIRNAGIISRLNAIAVSRRRQADAIATNRESPSILHGEPITGDRTPRP